MMKLFSRKGFEPLRHTSLNMQYAATVYSVSLRKLTPIFGSGNRSNDLILYHCQTSHTAERCGVISLRSCHHNVREYAWAERLPAGRQEAKRRTTASMRFRFVKKDCAEIKELHPNFFSNPVFQNLTVLFDRIFEKASHTRGR